MKIKPVLMLGTTLGLWAVFAAEAVVAAPIEGGAASVAVPRPPTAEAMARFLGFPKTFKFRMEKKEKSLMFEEARPLSVTYYSAEKQSAYSYSLELHKAGSLFNGKRAEYEQWLEKSANELAGRQREYAEENLIKYGWMPRARNGMEKMIDVEVRPGGRKVFSTVFGGGPGGGVSGVFTTVGEYDVLLLQFAFGGDGDDPEETERMRKMLAPTKSAAEAFAQMERVMPIFPQIAAEANLAAAEAATQAAREKAIRAKPAPRVPTGAELAKCLGFARPVALKADKVYPPAEDGTIMFSWMFDGFKPIWHTEYRAPEQLNGYYAITIYPARSLFGSDRDWFENWLEHPVPFDRTVRDGIEARDEARRESPSFRSFGPTVSAQERAEREKQEESAKQKRLAKEAEMRSPPFTRVETRPNGRKVFFHTFERSSGDKAAVAFSTLGDYDVVLTQFPDGFMDPDEAPKTPIAHHDVLQAFGELEKLFLR